MVAAQVAVVNRSRVWLFYAIHGAGQRRFGGHVSPDTDSVVDWKDTSTATNVWVEVKPWSGIPYRPDGTHPKYPHLADGVDAVGYGKTAKKTIEKVYTGQDLWKKNSTWEYIRVAAGNRTTVAVEGGFTPQAPGSQIKLKNLGMERTPEEQQRIVREKSTFSPINGSSWFERTFREARGYRK